MKLDDRKWEILKAIVKTYLETGEPVGSRTISKYADLNPTLPQDGFLPMQVIAYMWTA